jgi:predicted RNA polymerase sigma factor
MAFGPAAGLEIVDSLTGEPALKNYHLLPSVRGDFLAKLGRFDEARAEFQRAASLTRNTRERSLLLERAREAGTHNEQQSIPAAPPTDLIEPPVSLGSRRRGTRRPAS